MTARIMHCYFLTFVY